jgi:hypothetical protein
MPQYIIRIIKQVQILQKVEERVIEAPSLASAQREAAFILGENYADQPDIEAETGEKEPDDKKEEKKHGQSPF